MFAPLARWFLDFIYRPQFAAQRTWATGPAGPRGRLLHYALRAPQKIHLVKFGINYHFSWGKAPWAGKAPVVARY
jgi:hypothetical protein